MDPRQSRVAVAAIAFAFAAASCSADTSSEPSSTTSGEPTLTSASRTTTSASEAETPDVMDRWDGINLIVWIEPDADATVHGEVVGRIQQDAAVRSWRFVDREETFAEFQQLIVADFPIAGTIKPEQLPTSYRLWVNESALDRVEAAFTSTTGVRDVVERADEADPRLLERLQAICSGREMPSVDFVVWVETGAGDDIVSALRARIEGIEAAWWRYQDHEATYEEFRELFADEPELLERLTAETVPASFSVVVDGRRDTADALAADLRLEPGVRDVLTAWSSC